MSKPEHLITADDTTLKTILQGSKPVVLYLHNGEAQNRALTDAVSKIAKKHEDDLDIASINITENPVTAAKYKDYPVPAVVTIEQKLFGMRVKSAAGEIRPADMRDHVAFLLGTGEDPQEIAERRSAKADRSAKKSTSGAKDVTASTFKKDVLKSKIPVLVDFWAPWCGPCRQVSPMIEQLGQEYRGKVRVVKINVDDNPTLAKKYNVMSIPTIMVFKGGIVVETTKGAQPKNVVKRMVDDVLIG